MAFLKVDDLESGSPIQDWSSFAVDNSAQVYDQYSLSVSTFNASKFDSNDLQDGNVTTNDTLRFWTKMANATGNANDFSELIVYAEDNTVLIRFVFFLDNTIYTSDSDLGLTQADIWNALDIYSVEITPDFGNNQYDLIIRNRTTGTLAVNETRGFANSAGSTTGSDFGAILIQQDTTSSGDVFISYWDRIPYTNQTEPVGTTFTMTNNTVRDTVPVNVNDTQ